MTDGRQKFFKLWSVGGRAGQFFLEHAFASRRLQVLELGGEVLSAGRDAGRCNFAGDLYVQVDRPVTPSMVRSPVTRARCSSRFSTLVEVKRISGNLATLKKTSLRK